MTTSRLPETDSSTALRRLRLRYPGVCAPCGTGLARGMEARYDPAATTVCCLVCPVQGVDLSEPAIDYGIAGGSARREFERRAANRKARVTGRFGDRLGSVSVALTAEPRTTSAWASGAHGEEKLAEALARVPGLSVLHDRCLPGTG